MAGSHLSYPPSVIGSTVPGGTAGSVLFIDANGALGQDNSNFFWDTSNKRLGLLTAAPTQTVTLGSTSTGMVLFNTADQVTNFEKVSLAWESNQFNIAMKEGGTGTIRSLALQAFNASGANKTQFIVNRSATLPWAQITTDSTSSANATTGFFDITSSPGSSSTNVQISVSIRPTYAQSNGAGYTTLLINSTESSVGTGAKLLQDWQVGTVSKVKVTNAGLQSFSNTATGAVFNNQLDEVTNFERVTLGWISNVFTIQNITGGTSPSRTLRLLASGNGAANNTFDLNPGNSGANANFSFTIGSGVTRTYVGILGSASQSSGITTFLQINPTLTQTSTAGYNMLFINPTESTTGSGAKNLILAQVGSADRFKVDNIGNVTSVGTIVAGNNNSVTATVPSVLATVTGINAKTTGATALYTVPTGKTAYITGCIVYCTAASAITNGPSIDIGVVAGDIYPNTAINALTVTTKFYNFATLGMFSSSAAAAVISATINAASTGTSQTIAIDLLGYLK